MNIGLLAVDSNYPNLALMKISAKHKVRGHSVEWYNQFNHYDKVYMTKVFSFTKDYMQYITNADCVEKGGTGYDIRKVLPMKIDRMQPDYSIFRRLTARQPTVSLLVGVLTDASGVWFPRKKVILLLIWISKR